MRSGIGSVGFNHLVIHPQWGSYLSLGELLIDRDLTPFADAIAYNVRPMADMQQLVPGAVACCAPERRRCVEACPTKALTDSGFNAGRCLAYWTTQHKGEIPDEFADAMGEVMWGCDRCQLVCPRNRDFNVPMPENHPLMGLTLKEILTLSARQLRKRLAGSVMAEGHPYMLQRNACIVVGNRRDKTYFFELVNILENHTCDWVRSAAQRALNKIGETEQ